MRAIAICAAKDECVYLLEWICYQRAIGFDEVLVVTNDNEDYTTDLLSRISAVSPWLHFIEHSVQRGDIAPQVQAYRLAHRWLLEKSYEGIAGVFDVDEFLDTVDLPVKDFFEQKSPVDCILVNWRVFGSSGHVTRSPGLVIERFLHCSESSFRHNIEFKSLFRVDQSLRRFNPHFPWYNDYRSRKYKLIDGEEVPAQYLMEKPYTKHVKICHDGAQVNHYAIKSLEEFGWRSRRGRGAQTAKHAKSFPRHTPAYFKEMDRNEITCDFAWEAATKTRRIMEELYDAASLKSILPAVDFGL